MSCRKQHDVDLNKSQDRKMRDRKMEFGAIKEVLIWKQQLAHEHFSVLHLSVIVFDVKNRRAM